MNGTEAPDRIALPLGWVRDWLGGDQAPGEVTIDVGAGLTMRAALRDGRLATLLLRMPPDTVPSTARLLDGSTEIDVVTRPATTTPGDFEVELPAALGDTPTLLLELATAAAPAAQTTPTLE